MSRSYHLLDTRDLRGGFWVFYEPQPKSRPVLRPEYGDLQCKRCKKLDGWAALRRGISPGIPARASRRDAVESDDGVLVVSSRSKNVLESVPGVEAEFFPFPASPDYWAVLPVRTFYPPPDGRIYTPIEPRTEGEPFQLRSRACKKCGRFKEVTFNWEWFAVPDDVVLAGVVLEEPSWACDICWIASDEVADAIEAAGLSGWWIHRNAFKE